jgi:hypothetical protein
MSAHGSHGPILSFLNHCYEITQVPQVRSHSMPERFVPQLTKYFSRLPYEPTGAPMEVGLSIDKGLLPTRFYAFSRSPAVAQ